MPTVRSHGLDIYYETRGSGPALVFAHGAGGNTLIWWQQVPFFAERYRVIVFDHRGFGRSQGKGDVFDPGLFADDVRAILDAEGVDGAAFVCQSMGGWTGVQLVRTSPERVRALVLCDTPGGIMTERVMQAALAARQKVADGATTVDMTLAPDFPRRQPHMAHLYEQISGLNPEIDPDKLMRLAQLAVPLDELKGWPVPTLVLAGQHDAFFAPAALRTVADAIPRAEFSEVQGSGHSIYFEAPRVFNHVVAAFLQKHNIS